MPVRNAPGATEGTSNQTVLRLPVVANGRTASDRKILCWYLLLLLLGLLRHTPLHLVLPLIIGREEGPTALLCLLVQNVHLKGQTRRAGNLAYAELLWCNLLEVKPDDTVPIAGESAAYRERQVKIS